MSDAVLCVLMLGALDGSTARGWMTRRVVRRYRRLFGAGIFDGPTNQ